MRGHGLWLAIAAFLSQDAAAQGWIERGGREPLSGPPGVVRTASKVRITITGRLARFEIEETFRNDGVTVAEGNYLYPLPADAAFSDFSLFFGDQELRGEVLPAEQARGIYQQIVRTMRDPALLTLAGHGLLRARVFPIQPRETRRVVLRYAQVLAADAGAFRLRYPLGSRGGGPITVTLTADDPDRFGLPWSPTHSATRSLREGRLEVCVDARPEGTLELLLPLRAGVAAATVLAHASRRDERLFLLVLSPPPAPDRSQVLPRDLTFVLDVSGSMAGAKLEQARAALIQGLAGLRAQDRFRIITFSTRVTEFRDGPVAVTPAALREARRFVEELRAGGGTNIGEALDAVSRARPARGRLGLVVFLSDGVPTVGERDPERLAAEAATHGASRFFPIGIGHDVNTWLLDRLAAEARGRVEYVAPGADVEATVATVLSRLDAPALTDLRIVSAPVRLLDLAPADLPDLFHGEELVVFGRYEGTGRGPVVIEGERHGRRERFVARAVFPVHQPDNHFIGPLWASRRIGDLTRQLRLEGHSAALVEQIRDLGLRHGIITEYTSYLVLEPGMPIPTPGRPGDVASPAAQTGAAAFDRAERSARLSAAKTLNEVAAANRAGASDDRRHVAGRVFVRRSGVWTDLAHADSVQVVEIESYSPAWFALTAALPELSPWLAAGDEVLIAGARVSLRIGRTGIATWPASTLERVVRGFRGR